MCFWFLFRVRPGSAVPMPWHHQAPSPEGWPPLPILLLLVSLHVPEQKPCATGPGTPFGAAPILRWVPVICFHKNFILPAIQKLHNLPHPTCDPPGMWPILPFSSTLSQPGIQDQILGSPDPWEHPPMKHQDLNVAHSLVLILSPSLPSGPGQGMPHNSWCSAASIKDPHLCSI